MTVKTTTTFWLFAAAVLLWAGSAQAQSTTSEVDSVRLSTLVEGDYQIDRYLVEEAAGADYAIRYRISNATLNKSLDNNLKELDELQLLMGETFADTLNRVERVHIKGYASPDGPAALNRTLSKQRAEDMRRYLDRTYNLSKHYKVQMDAATASWSDAYDAVCNSSIPHRDSVLKIIADRSLTESAKQAHLKRMPEVWSYLAAHILPPMRRVAVNVDYYNGAIVEHRTLLRPTEPNPEPEVILLERVVERVVDPCCDELLQQESIGVILDMPYEGVDFQ